MARIRHLIIDQLKPIFKQHGYKFKSGYYPSFVRAEEEHIYSVWFQMGTKYQIMNGGNMMIADLRVERIILEIGFPNDDLSVYRQGKEQMFTISDISEMALSMSGNQLNTEEKALLFTQAVITYLDEYGWNFAQYYSYLPNVLTRMNQLDATGKYWNGILCGLADYLFRGLIIAKLCDDPDFNNKLVICDEKFYKASHLQSWLPYYQKLRTKLTLSKIQSVV